MRIGRFHFPGDEPLIMGVVNVTPDSFSDGGLHASTAAAIEHGFRLIEEGAAILDIGGESTRPGAADVTVETELSRVLPVLDALRDAGAALSVDTRKPAVMRAVLAAGADMINDIEGFRSPAAIDAVAGSPHCGLCVMHMQGLPASMQDDPRYYRVTEEIANWLSDRVAALRAAGIGAERVLIDPGIGFGKRLEHNVELLARLERLSAIAPVLIGVSRKSMLGALTGRAVHERLAASLAGLLAAVARGARIVRVHDVRETRDALVVWQAIARAGA
jgi:dihydropteroate synthase